MSRAAQKLISASGSKADFEIAQSCRFNYSDQAYLSRTPSSTGNRRTWSLSFWAKFAYPQNTYVFSGGTVAGATGVEAFMLSGGFQDIYFGQSYAPTYWRTSTVYDQGIDPAAWYHIFHIHDTTQGTAANRTRTWINGVEFVMGTTEHHSSFSFPDENEQGTLNTQVLHRIGGMDDNSQYMDGNLAEMHFIDGTAKAVGDFGETNSDTSQWVPKQYTGGSYGTNGFYLKFESGAIGTDSSGNGNNWTANNIANSDILLDTPTNNFPTYTDLHNGSTALTEGNLKFVNSTGNSDTSCTMQIPFTGKWYWEIRATAVDAMYYGIVKTEYSDTAGTYSSLGRKVLYDGNYWNGSSSASYGSSYSNGDIVNVAFDCDNSKLYFGKNGTWFNSGDPAAGSNPAGSVTASEGWVPNMYGNSGTQNDLNFGQNGTFNGLVTAQGNADGNGYGNFYYSPPTGFLALCTQNLPDPAVKKSTEYFNPIIYTGNGSTQSITGVGFQPDMVWGKNRTANDDHWMSDSVRGVNYRIKANSDDAQDDNDDGVTAFGSDGFSLGDDDDYNTNTENYVAWSWKAGGSAGGAGSGGSNTDGNMANWNTVSTTAGFAIGAYTGTGGVKTVGHGLGKAPECILVKCRSDAIDWCVYFGDPTDSLTLNDAAARDDNDNRWNDTAPTSTVFTIYSSNEVNDSGKTYVYYAFAGIEGFSKFGLYTGNASTDGPMVTLGFRPAFVIIKRLDAGSMGWGMFDNKRSPSNEVDELLYANSNDAEADSDSLNFLSNGFKVITSGSDFINGSGGTMFYMAFAESPFKYANAR